MQNELTGEHTCILLHQLHVGSAEGAEGAESGAETGDPPHYWLEHYFRGDGSTALYCPSNTSQEATRQPCVLTQYVSRGTTGILIFRTVPAYAHF